MRKIILFYLFSLSIIILSWCSSQEISVNKTDDSIITWDLGITTGNTSTDDEVYDNYAPVRTLDQTKFWEEWKSDQWFVVNDKVWKGNYYENRNWIYIGTMGIQAADIIYGYISWNFYMDFGTEVIQLPVDETTYISYYPQLENPNYTGTGTLQVQDKRKNYQICKDGYSMEQEEVVYDREKYEGLLDKNPIRCFGEDKTYIYGRRQYGKWEWSGYELMRIRK